MFNIGPKRPPKCPMLLHKEYFELGDTLNIKTSFGHVSTVIKKDGYYIIKTRLLTWQTDLIEELTIECCGQRLLYWNHCEH